MLNSNSSNLVDSTDNNTIKIIKHEYTAGFDNRTTDINGEITDDGSNISHVKDPRLFCTTLAMKKKRNYHLDPLDLPLPKFKIDQYWIGPMPSKEVTFANLNDNINKQFLEEMCMKFGEIVECKIYYHPKSKKHLGIAKVLFQTQTSASECCKSLNNTTKMGNIMQVFLDTLGNERIKLIENLCNPSAVSTSTLNNKLPIQLQNQANNLKKSTTNNSNSSSPIRSTQSPFTDINSTVNLNLNINNHNQSPQTNESPNINTISSLTSNSNTVTSDLRSNSLDSRIKALFNINIVPNLDNLLGPQAVTSSPPVLQPTVPSTNFHYIQPPMPSSLPPPPPPQTLTSQQAPQQQKFDSVNNQESTKIAPPPPSIDQQTLLNNSKKYIEQIKQKSMNLIINELYEVIKKDLSKKLIEQYSFKLIDDWCSNPKAFAATSSASTSSSSNLGMNQYNSKNENIKSIDQRHHYINQNKLNSSYHHNHHHHHHHHRPVTPPSPPPVSPPPQSRSQHNRSSLPWQQQYHHHSPYSAPITSSFSSQQQNPKYFRYPSASSSSYSNNNLSASKSYKSRQSRSRSRSTDSNVQNSTNSNNNSPRKINKLAVKKSTSSSSSTSR